MRPTVDDMTSTCVDHAVDIHDAVPVVLLDGGLATLRPLRDGEGGPQLSVLAAMSDASRLQRFLTSMPIPPPAAVMRALATLDEDLHAAWLATVDGVPVGVARWVRVSAEVAEVAFEVVDAHHGRGIGSLLLEAVTLDAVAHGVRRLRADVHPSNVASVRLLRQVGLELRLVDGLFSGESPIRLAPKLRQPELRRLQDHRAPVG